jgi:hypothetical protein
MKTTIRTIGLAAALAVLLATGVRAQPAPLESRLNEAAAPSVEAVSNLPTAELSSLDLHALDEQWWKETGKAHAEAMHSTDADVRERTMQNVIFLASHYPEQVRFGSLGTPLLETYLFDQDEGHRLLALSAIYAMRDDAALRHISQYVQLERSDRVRKLTNKVLAEYFGPKS